MGFLCSSDTQIAHFHLVLELKRMEKDLQGMKTQAEGLSKEYDRVLDENEKLQVC